MGRIRQRLDALEKETGQRDGLCTCALRVVYDGGAVSYTHLSLAASFASSLEPITTAWH